MQIIIDISPDLAAKYLAYHRGDNPNSNAETDPEYLTELLLRHLEQLANLRILQERTIVATSPEQLAFWQSQTAFAVSKLALGLYPEAKL